MSTTAIIFLIFVYAIPPIAILALLLSHRPSRGNDAEMERLAMRELRGGRRRLVVNEEDSSGLSEVWSEDEESPKEDGKAAELENEGTLGGSEEDESEMVRRKDENTGARRRATRRGGGTRRG